MTWFLWNTGFWASNSEYAYVLYFASDVNYEGEEQAKIYREMRQDLFHIGFKIL